MSKMVSVVSEPAELAGEVMRAHTRLHADEARWEVGKSRLDLTARPFLAQDDRATAIVADDVERVLADIDADHGDLGACCLGHGRAPGDAAPCQRRSLAGQEHGRTIPLAELNVNASISQSGERRETVSRRSEKLVA